MNTYKEQHFKVSKLEYENTCSFSLACPQYNIKRGRIFRFLYGGKKGGVGSNNIKQFTQKGGYQKKKKRKITQCKSSTWLE